MYKGNFTKTAIAGRIYIPSPSKFSSLFNSSLYCLTKIIHDGERYCIVPISEGPYVNPNEVDRGGGVR